MIREKRSKQIAIRLTEREYMHLKTQAKISGLKMEPCLRSLIMGLEVKPKPSGEYIALLREISAIGNNFNQLVRIANANKRVSYPQLEECRNMFSEMFKLVKSSL